MDVAIVAALALTLGLVLGYGAGVVRALRAEGRRRAAAGASGVLAQVWSDGAPTRNAADIWAGRIRITLGGAEHVLPVAPRKLAREWLGSLDARFATTAALLEAKDVPDALRVLAAHTDSLYDLLAEYAAAVGVTLPVRDSELDFASDPEILRATVEVWAALHPLAVALATSETSLTTTRGLSAASTTSSPTPTAGDATTSTASSQTSSSSATSTPRKRASRPGTAASSRAGSKPSASAPSSLVTRSSTASGGRARAPEAGSADSPAPRSSRP